MKLGRRLLQSLWNADFARFAVVGGTATLVHGFGLIALSSLTGHQLLANTLAVAASSQVSYFGHKAFTFRSATPHRIALPKFLVQCAFAWMVSSAMVALLAPTLGVPRTAALVMVTLPVLSYFVFKHWTFASPREVAPTSETGRS